MVIGKNKLAVPIQQSGTGNMFNSNRLNTLKQVIRSTAIG
jgi:hypothetical protein